MKPGSSHLRRSLVGLAALCLASSLELATWAQVTCPEEPPPPNCADDEDDCEACIGRGGFGGGGAGGGGLHRGGPGGTPGGPLPGLIDRNAPPEIVIDDPLLNSGCKGCEEEGGMATWQVLEPNLALEIVDAPLGYSPATGKNMQFGLRYLQAWAEFDNQLHEKIFGFGTNWFSGWQSWLTYTPSQPYVSLNLYAGGRRMAFTQDANGDWINLETNIRVVQVASPPTGYELYYRSGAKDIYEDMPNTIGFGALKRRIDPRGRTIVFTYDNTLWNAGSWAKLISITDR